MKSIITICFLSCLFMVNAQHIELSTQTANTNSFSEICSKAENEYLGKERGKGSGYKQFARWHEHMANHLVDGRIVNYGYLNMKAYQKRVENQGARFFDSPGGTWQYLGLNHWSNTPDLNGGYNFGGWIPGNGRVNRLAGDPFNTNILYAGSASGGLWKYNSNTEVWVPLTDGMPNISVSGIAVDHSVQGTMYVLTGDGDSNGNATPSSIGVLKTTNNGETWFRTALAWDLDTIAVEPYSLLMHPDSNNVLYALTNFGLYKTTDGGATWPLILPGFRCFDMEFKPGLPSTLYLSGDSMVYRSIDDAASWDTILTVKYGIAGIDANMNRRIEIAVTPSNNNLIYAVGGNQNRFKGIFRSIDGGLTFDTLVSISPNILGQFKNPSDGDKTQVWYDLALSAHPTNPDMLYVGAINLWRYWIGGPDADLQRKTFWNQTQIDDGDIYMHSDFHDLLYVGDTLYAAHDGGVSRAYIPATGEPVWTDISQGLGIAQLYHIAINQNDNNNILSGTQDNGTNKYTGSTTFIHKRGGDGFACHINFNDPNITYTSKQYGKIWISADNDFTYTEILSPGTSSTMRFNFAFEMDPNDPAKLLIGRRGDIIYSTNGLSFPNSKTVKVNWYTNAIAVAPSNSNIVYAVAATRFYSDSCELYINTDFYGTGNFIEIDVPDTIGLQPITDIIVDPVDSAKIWISCGGYTAGAKVFFSENRGATWTNLSSTMANVPVWSLVKGEGTNNDIYAGTEIGVFYRDDDINHWHYFNNGLPIVPVRDLQINTIQNELYAATYGRGLWKSSTYGDCSVGISLTPANDPSNPIYTGVQRYEASSFITSTRIVTGGLGSDVRYQAGTTVKLIPGFHAKTGNQFNASIGACGTQTSSPNIQVLNGSLIMD